MVDAAVDRFGRLDILVNNAGMSIRKPAETYSATEWHSVLDTNLTGAFICAQAAHPAMKQGGGGKIINIGSMFSIFGAAYAVPYAASKGGLVQLTKSLAAAWAVDNIQVNAVLPGWIDTELTRDARREVAGLNERVLARTPAGRWGVPDDLAGIAVFLASRRLRLRHRRRHPGRWRLFCLGLILGGPIPARSPAQQHPPEVAPAEQVHMEMRHFLVTVTTAVGDDAVAGFGDTPLSGDLPQGADHGRMLRRRGLSGKIVERDIFALGDDQDVGRGQRIDVVEGEDVLVLIDFVAWDLATQNAGKDVIAIVGHQPLPIELRRIQLVQTHLTSSCPAHGSARCAARGRASCRTSTEA